MTLAKCVIILILYHLIACAAGQSPVANKDIERPNFRIVAPQFMCRNKKTKDASEIPAPPEVTVSFQTRGGAQLKYRVQIFFETLGPLKGQQHTLRIWKSVRALEKRVRNDEESITQKNQLSIQNTELTSGVRYRFEITGLDDQGRMSDVRNFSITYREGAEFGSQIEQLGTVTNDAVSLMLLGAETTYGDIPIVIEAKAIWCNPTNEYYFKWDMAELQEQPQYAQYFTTKSKLLRLPSGILMANRSYFVTGDLLRDGELIQQASMRIKVIAKGYTARINPEIAMIGMQKTINIYLILTDPDNTGENFKIAWTCTSTISNADCDYFEPSSSTIQPILLLLPDEYEVTATVSLNDVETVLKSKISINADIIAYGYVLKTPVNPISPIEAYQVEAIIEDLVPNCYAEWTVVKEDGFAFFDIATIPIGLGNVTIRDVRETLLSELADYGNDTLSQDIPLVIPRKGEYPGWKGLESDVKYKFRLSTTCPRPINENEVEDRGNITSYTDVVIETNGPPEGQELEIEPTDGEALRTIFRFSSGMAKDFAIDYPLKYLYGYIVEDYVVYVGEFYENTITRSDLPYSAKPIQTFYQICDARDSCSEYVYGLNITTSLSDNFTTTEFEYKQDIIEKNMQNLELDMSFGAALACVFTYKHLADKTFYTNIINVIKNAIQATIKLIKAEKIFIYSDSDVLYFVKLSERILEVMTVQDENIFSELLELLDKYDVRNEKLRKLDDLEQRHARKKRQVLNNPREKSNGNLETFKTAFSLLTKMNASGERIIDHVVKISKNYCQTTETSLPVQLNFKEISIQIAKYRQHVIFGNNIKFSFKNFINTASMHVSEMLPLESSGQYCVVTTGIAKPAADEIYSLIIYEMNEKGPILVEANDDHDYGYIYEITLNGIANYSRALCAIKTSSASEWNIDQCRRIGISERSIKCECSNFGIFKATIANDTIFNMVIAQTTALPLTTLATLTTAPAKDVASTNFPSPPTEITILSSTAQTNILTTPVPASLVPASPVPISPVPASPVPTSTVPASPVPASPVPASPVPTSPVPASPVNAFTAPVPTSPEEITSVSQIAQTPAPPTTQPITPTPPPDTTATLPITPIPADPTTSSSAQYVNLITTTPEARQTIPTNSTEEVSGTFASTVLSYTSAFLVIFLGAGFGTFIYIAYKRRGFEKLIVPQQQEIENIISRQPAAGVRYAQFHDESNMDGQFADGRF